MKGNFEQCLALTLKEEGGWVNNKYDPGGETNMGVTKRVWEEWVGHPVPPGSLKSLTVADVEPLYRQKYWDKVRGDDLPNGVDYAVFDFAVNSGVSRSTKFLQDAVGAKPDGIIGPRTLAAVNEANPRDLIDEICDNRLAYLQSLPTWDKFGRGWSKRVARVQEAAFNMAME
jgi:lysozyme family protein